MTSSAKLLLSPNAPIQNELRDVYNLALDEAEELYIASAYLTEWDTAYKLGTACKSLVFLVGTDFNLTRKQAMRNVLRWVPKQIAFSFKAIDAPSGNFHPKIVAWKAADGRHGIGHGAYTDSQYGRPLNFYKTIAAIDFLTFISSLATTKMSGFVPDHTPESRNLAARYISLANMSTAG